VKPSPARLHKRNPVAPLLLLTSQDLKKKPKLREKYGIEDAWVMPFEVIPIIDIPGYGDAAAQVVCEQLKVQSQNDTAKLAEAKQLVYLKVQHTALLPVFCLVTNCLHVCLHVFGG
jgi:hypothetical protein